MEGGVGGGVAATEWGAMAEGARVVEMVDVEMEEEMVMAAPQAVAGRVVAKVLAQVEVEVGKEDGVEGLLEVVALLVIQAGRVEYEEDHVAVRREAAREV